MKSSTAVLLEDHLRKVDEASRLERTDRLAELMLLGEPADGRMLFGDCHHALHEAQWSYINGQHLCTILGVQACLEKLLSGLIAFAEYGSPDRSYSRLLKSAAAQGILSSSEYELLTA